MRFRPLLRYLTIRWCEVLGNIYLFSLGILLLSCLQQITLLLRSHFSVGDEDEKCSLLETGILPALISMYGISSMELYSEWGRRYYLQIIFPGILFQVCGVKLRLLGGILWYSCHVKPRASPQNYREMC